MTAPPTSAGHGVIHTWVIPVVVGLFTTAVFIWLYTQPTLRTPPPLSDLSNVDLYKVKVDETVCVDRGTRWIRRFSLKDDENVYFQIDGVRDASKGFTTYLLPASEYEKMREGKGFVHYPMLHNERATSIAVAGAMKEGTYALVIENTRNWWDSMEVHVRITIDPS